MSPCEGINFTGAFGYDFSSNVGLELGLTYKLAQECEEKDQFETQTQTTTYTGSFFGFSPTLVINAPLDNVKPFMKIGLLIALPATEFESVDNEGNTGKGTFGGGVDFGLTGGVGILVPLSTKINFFAEFDFVSFTWKPDEVEVTDTDGTTETIKFEDEWTSNDENTQGPVFLPFSNVGLNIGTSEAARRSEHSVLIDRTVDFAAVCAEWQKGQVSPEFREPLTSNVPVLILSGAADPITPPRHAEKVAESLTNELHLIFAGMGHGNLSNRCSSDLFTDFIESASIEGLDASCVEGVEPPPFFVDFSGPRP